MTKIVTAVNAMISNPDLICQVENSCYNSDELFFIYKDKYYWSISKCDSSSNFYLHYYPKATSIKELTLIDGDEWQHYHPMVSYDTHELATKEAMSTFRELYHITNEKLLGMDEILNDIIGDDFL